MAAGAWMLLLLTSLALVRQARCCGGRKQWKLDFISDFAAGGFLHAFSGVCFHDCLRACTALANCAMFAHSVNNATCLLYNRTMSVTNGGVVAPDTRYWRDGACPGNLGYSERSGTCYKFVAIGKNWTEARQHCREEGGDLYIADTAEKRGILSGFSPVIVGGRYQGGAWRWVNGAAVSTMPLGYSFWSTGDLCLILYGVNLESRSCSMNAPFVCEISL